MKTPAPPSKESASGWTAVLLVFCGVLGLSLLAAKCNGPSQITTLSCNAEAFAKGWCD